MTGHVVPDMLCGDFKTSVPVRRGAPSPQDLPIERFAKALGTAEKETTAKHLENER